MLRTRLVILLTAIALLTVGLAAPAQAGPEGSFVSMINASRSANGLPPLQSHSGLASGAEAWSQQMMAAGAISHNPDLGSITGGWESLGENVGVGPTAEVLHQAFMNSAGHRRNILGDYTHVGVGVVVESDTRMWVTVVFMKEKGASAPAATTTTTTPIAATAPAVESQPEPPPAPAPAVEAPVGVATAASRDETAVAAVPHTPEPPVQIGFPGLAHPIAI